MPYGQCPICGMVYHLQVTDPAQWYKDRGLKFGDLLIEKCYSCWRELKLTDRVEILLPPPDMEGVKAGDVGHVVEVVTTADGKKQYRIEAGDPPEQPQWTAVFEREAITYAPRGMQPFKDSRNALLKHRITLHFPEPSVAYCAVEGKKRMDVNVQDLYDQYANWSLTPERFADEIRRRLGMHDVI